MFCPAVTSSWPAWPVEMPSSWMVRGAAAATSCSSSPSSAAISSSSASIALGDRAQRELRGLGRAAKLVGRRAEPCAEGGLAAERLAAGELVAELLRGGDDQVAELDHRGAAGLHGAVARDAQQPDRLDDPVGLLRDRGRFAGQEQPGGHLRVDRVALADTPAGMRVRLVDLDDPNAVLAQVAHERGGIGAGRLDRDGVDLSEAAQPVQQLPVSRRRGRKALRGEQRSALIERRGVMGVRVRVNPANNERVLLRHAVHAVLSVRRAARSGRADRTVTRHFCDQVPMRSRRPTRPPIWAINGGQPEADRSPQDTRTVSLAKSDPRPTAKGIFTVCETASLDKQACWCRRRLLPVVRSERAHGRCSDACSPHKAQVRCRRRVKYACLTFTFPSVNLLAQG